MFVRSGFARPPPVASCQFNHHHHHHHPHPGTSCWPTSHPASMPIRACFCCRCRRRRRRRRLPCTQILCARRYSIARSVNTLLLTVDDCPTDCQTVRQSTISIFNSIYICLPCLPTLLPPSVFRLAASTIRLAMVNRA